MRPSLKDFALPCLVLIMGISIAGSGTVGILYDMAGALPIRRAPPGGIRPVDAMWWLRGCLVTPGCRVSVRALLATSAAAHARVVWFGCLAALLSTVWLTALRVREQRSRRPIRDARFASSGELRRRMRRSSGAWFPLGYAGVGWSQPIRLPEEAFARHVLVLGLTGAHKTTAVTFPVLLEASHAGVSVVALDLKYGEEDSLARVAPEWRRCGRDVLVFAPVDSVSLKWNPVASCRTLGDAHALAALLFDDADATDPDLLYWVGAERHVCAALIFAVAMDGGPPTLERLRALCAAGPGAMHSYLQTHPVSPSLTAHLGAYRAMLAKDEAGILQGIASRLDPWTDEAVCLATGVGEAWEHIDFRRLRREPALLIVGIPQAARSRLRWLCHLFLRCLAACFLGPREPHEQIRVLQVLEELPAWGPLPGLADHLATLRSRHVSVLATIQSESQGASVYGANGWAAVAANLVTKIYFPSLADPDAESLSRVLGTARMEDVARSRGWGSGGPTGQEHRRQIPVPLQRPEELQGIGWGENEILVRCPGLPPARLWCPPFFARPEYRGRVPDLPPSTADLVVYHHMRYKSIHGTPSSRDRVPANRLSNAGPASETVAPPSVEAQDGSDPESGAGAVVATGKDIEALTRFAESLVGHLAGPPPMGDGSRTVARGVRRHGRLVDVRVDPEVALRLCGDPAEASVVLRRWATLRWVRRVRPVFILERRALDALDVTLRRRLVAACSPRHEEPR
jgi:type IV secretory pathway TraG/TraD family ATPase VirD4